MNIIRARRERTEAGSADGVVEGALGRRSVLGGIAALPVLYGIGSAAPALAAASAPGATAARIGGAPRTAGAPTRIAVLGPFAEGEGWYELRHAGKSAERVTWDARKLPFLLLYGEFGATAEEPYHNRIYSLALQTFSRNPYSRTVPAE